MNTWIRKALQVGIIAAGIVLAGGAAAQASQPELETTDITKGDKTAVVQEVLETVDVHNIQIGLVNLQDILNENDIPIDALNNNDILASEGDGNKGGVSSANAVETD